MSNSMILFRLGRLLNTQMISKGLKNIGNHDKNMFLFSFLFLENAKVVLFLKQMEVCFRPFFSARKVKSLMKGFIWSLICLLSNSVFFSFQTIKKITVSYQYHVYLLCVRLYQVRCLRRSML